MSVNPATGESFVVLTHGPTPGSAVFLLATLAADTVHPDVNLTVYQHGRRPDTWALPLGMFIDALAGGRPCHVQYHAWPETDRYIGVALPGRRGDRYYWLPRVDVNARVTAIVDARFAELEPVAAGGVL